MECTVYLTRIINSAQCIATTIIRKLDFLLYNKTLSMTEKVFKVGGLGIRLTACDEMAVTYAVADIT